MIYLLVFMLIALGIVGTSPVRGYAKFLAPECLVIFLLVAIFAIRPLFASRFAVSVQAQGRFYGYIPSPEGQALAQRAGMLFALSLLMGWLIARTRMHRYINSEAKPREHFGNSCSEPERRASFPGLAILGLAVGGAVAYALSLAALKGPSVLVTLGRGRTDFALLGGVPEFVVMLPLVGSVAAAVGLLIAKPGFAGWLAVVCAVLLSVALTAQLGNRRFIIPAVALPLMAAVFTKRMRLRSWHIPLAVSAFLWLTILPSVRSAGSRLPGEGLVSGSVRYVRDGGLLKGFSDFFVSYDTEMFDYVAIYAQRWSSGNAPVGLGRGTVIDLVLHPLPSGWVPGDAFSDTVLTSFWGGGCGYPVCPVASVVGVTFFDFGFWGLPIFGMAFGVLLHKLSSNIVRLPLLAPTRQIVTLCFAAMAPIIFRTNFTYAIWWTIYLMIFGILVRRSLAGSMRRRSIDLSAARHPE